MIFANQPDVPNAAVLGKAGSVSEVISAKQSEFKTAVSKGSEDTTPDNNLVINPEIPVEPVVNFQTELANVIEDLLADGEQEQITDSQEQPQTEQPDVLPDIVTQANGNWKQRYLAALGNMPNSEDGEAVNEIPKDPIQNAIARLTYLLNTKGDVLSDKAKEAIGNVLEKLQLKIEGRIEDLFPADAEQEKAINAIITQAQGGESEISKLIDLINELIPQLAQGDAEPQVVIENGEVSENTDATQVLNQDENTEKVFQVDSETDAADETETGNTNKNLAALAEENISEESESDELLEQEPQAKAEKIISQQMPVNAFNVKSNNVPAAGDNSGSKEDVFADDEIKLTAEKTSESVNPQPMSQSDSNSNSFEQIFAAADTQNVTEFKGEMAQAETKPLNNLPEDTGQYVSEQIKEAIKSSADEGKNEITIRLNPPELGRVFIRLEEQDGQIAGMLEFSKAQTKAEVAQLIPQLIRSLQEAGVSVRRLDVVQSQQDNSSYQQNKQQNAQDYNGQQQPHYQHSEGHGWGPKVYQWLGSRMDYQGAGLSGQSSLSGSGVNVLI